MRRLPFLTLIDFAEHYHPRKFGLRIARYGWVEEEDAFGRCLSPAAIELLLRAEDGVRMVPSPPALVGTSTNDSCISILAAFSRVQGGRGFVGGSSRTYRGT